jgi:hypothetical protein
LPRKWVLAHLFLSGPPAAWPHRRAARGFIARLGAANSSKTINRRARQTAARAIDTFTDQHPMVAYRLRRYMTAVPTCFSLFLAGTFSTTPRILADFASAFTASLTTANEMLPVATFPALHG